MSYRYDYDTAILFTHQSRMLCSLESLGMNTKAPFGMDAKAPFGMNAKASFGEEQTLFKNGAIVKLEVVPTATPTEVPTAISTGTVVDKLHVSLVYAGNLADNEKNPNLYYFDLVDENNVGYKNNLFKTLIVNTNSSETSNIIKKMLNSNIKVIYLVRNGQANHKVTEGFRQRIGMNKDTSLTKDGITQARDAGKHFFKNLYKDKTMQNLFVGVSDLKRTSETARYFLYNAPEYNESINDSKYNTKFFTQILHVIPCSHEITQKKPPCDGDTNMVSSENRMMCKSRSNRPDLCNTIETTYDGRNITFEKKWDLYDAFYELGHRGLVHSITKDSVSESCRDTNMILELLSCVIHENYLRQREREWIKGGKSHKRKYKRLASKGKTKKRNRCHTKK